MSVKSRKIGIKKTSAPFAGESFIDQLNKGVIKSKYNSKFIFFVYKIKNYFLSRLAYWCPVNSLRVIFHRWRGVNIGNNVFIGLNCVLDHSNPEYIILENNTMLSGENYILTHSRPYEHFKGKIMSYIAPVHIKKGAWLGIRSTILPGVIIGENSIVSAGSIVKNNIPDSVIVEGNPAKIIADLNL